jgi:23S rRNA (adenine2503-C2)-methyltransferase
LAYVNFVCLNSKCLKDRPMTLNQDSPIVESSASPTLMEATKHFLGMKFAEIKKVLLDAGEPQYRVAQVQDWIYAKRVWDPFKMTNLPGKTKELLSRAFDWKLPQVKSILSGEDHTTKLLFSSRRGVFEAVVMRYEGRTSLCVSSQVGCKLACRFCQTGKLGFVRNLEIDEILGQFAVANDIVRAEGRKISHVVFMGMGEPLDNYANAIEAAKTLIGVPEAQSGGFGLSRKNVTISTSGIVPKIRDLANDCLCSLAISLHAAQDNLRDELMPINQKWPLSTLKEALLEYQRTTQQVITLEYIMIKDKNSSIKHAKDLVKWIHGLRVKVNLIPFNDHPGSSYSRPDDDVIRCFQKYLYDRSIPAPVRYSKGLDVSAACGQLAAKVLETLHETPKRSHVIA